MELVPHHTTIAPGPQTRRPGPIFNGEDNGEDRNCMIAVSKGPAAASSSSATVSNGMPSTGLETHQRVLVSASSSSTQTNSGRYCDGPSHAPFSRRSWVPTCTSSHVWWPGFTCARPSR